MRKWAVFLAVEASLKKKKEKHKTELKTRLTPSGIQSFADMYSCTELELAARRYIYSHFLDAIQQEEFLQLATEQLIDLLKSDQLQVNTEEQVCWS